MPHDCAVTSAIGSADFSTNSFSVTESYNCPDTFADPYAHILLVRARWRFLQKVHQAHRLRVLWRCKWVRALCRRQP